MYVVVKDSLPSFKMVFCLYFTYTFVDAIPVRLMAPKARNYHHTLIA